MMKKIKELFKKYKEVILYIIVGVFTTAISFLCQWIFSDLVKIPYEWITTVIALFISILFAFFANKLLVFEHKEKKGFFKELLLFYASRIFTSLLEIGVMGLFVDLLDYNKWVVKIIVTVIIMILNYVLSKFLVFTKKKEDVKEDKVKEATEEIKAEEKTEE